MIVYEPTQYTMEVICSLASDDFVGKQRRVLVTLYKRTTDEGTDYVVRGQTTLGPEPVECMQLSLRSGDFVIPIDQREKAEAVLAHVYDVADALYAIHVSAQVVHAGVPADAR